MLTRLCPPGGQEATPFYSFLGTFGPYYRIIMIAVGAVISFIMRYVVIAIFAWTVRLFTPYHLHTSYRPDVEINTVTDSHSEADHAAMAARNRKKSMDKSQHENGTGNGNGYHPESATDESSADEAEQNPYARQLRSRKQSTSKR